MPKIIPPIAGVIALLTILTFWVSTSLSELFGSHQTIAAVKGAIPYGFLILVPAMAIAGASGMKMGAKWRGKLISAKKRRMPIIAANGILVLIPAAFFLSYKAQLGQFDTTFYAVQVIELIAGATNITLLALNMRDGLQMTAARRRKPS